MDFLENLTIRNRLMFGFGTILALMVLLTVVGIQKVNQIDNTLTTITDINSVKQRYAINFRGSVHDRAIAVRDVVNARSWSEANTFTSEIEELAVFYQESETRLQQMLRSDIPFSSAEKRIIAEIEQIESRTLPLVQNIINAKRGQDQREAIRIMLDEARPAFIDWLAAINQFIDYQEKQNQQATPLAREVAGGFQNLMLLLSAGAIVLGVAIAVMIGNSLRCSLGAEPREAMESLSVIAGGDLTQELGTPHGKSMLASMGQMQQKLRQTVKDIGSVANELSDQTATVAAGSEEIYESAQRQDELTANTTENLRGMSESIGNVSQRAVKNRENAEAMVERAKSGFAAISASVEAMETITATVSDTVQQISVLEELVEQIGGITSTINGISDQTNLLALNAAIEAARAGESGRGFAVVADEVRTLAQSTGEATLEIQTTIEKVQQETASAVRSMQTTLPQVEEGKSRTENAMTLLREIEVSATNTLDNVGVVAESASQQVQGISAISDVVAELEKMSSQAVQSLQNNQQALASLNQLSTRLNDDVAYFKTDC